MSTPSFSPRTATVERTTAETDVSVALTLDGDGSYDVDTGVGFFDHMLSLFAKHGALDLEVRCDGDLEVDDHHTVEDVAIGLGRALDDALGDKAHIARYGHAYVPMDDALARAVVDLSGRGGLLRAEPGRRPVDGTGRTRVALRGRSRPLQPAPDRPPRAQRPPQD